MSNIVNRKGRVVEFMTARRTVDFVENVNLFRNKAFYDKKNNYVENLKWGEAFERYVSYLFDDLFGFILHRFETKEGQNRGENEEGFEIKYDRKMCSTGNVYIEVAELGTNGEWIDSGVAKIDNSKWFVIGDDDTIFIFNKNDLKLYDGVVKQYGQSKGFLIDKATAERIAKRVLKRID